MMAMWWWIACGEAPPTSASSSEFTMVDIRERTVVMDESWIYPHTTVVPVINQDEPRFQEAERLAESGNNLGAAQYLLALLKDRPDFVAAHSLLSSVFVRLGDIEQAIAAGHEVVRLAPSAWSLSNLATLYILNQDFAQAKQLLEASLAMDPKYFLSLRNLGSIAYQEKDYASAERYFQQFIRIEPDDTYGYVSYGQILVEQGKLEAARDVYQYRLRELSLDPEAKKHTPSGLTLDLPLALAEVYRRLGDEEAALVWIKQGIVWSWTYQGYWTSAAVYEDKAYMRLMHLLKTKDTEIQQEWIADLQLWCLAEATRITEPQRCEKLQGWLSTIDTAKD